MAEITVAHIRQLATRLGYSASEGKGLAFLNEDGHAYGLWMHMMQAGEEFIKSNLPRVFSKVNATELPEPAVEARSYHFPGFPSAANKISDLNNNLRI